MPEAERPNPDSRADVIIVGGGASGVLMAFHLLRDPTAEVRVTLIEKRPQLGRGVAYGTTNPDHLLNVRAASMSAVRDEPDHFWSWVCANANTASWEWKPGNDPLCFAPRMIYGDYLSSLTAPFVAHGSRPGRLRIIHGECLSIDEGRSGVTVTLADGSHHSADFGILATGHDARSKTSGCYVDAWTAPSDAGVDRNAKVLIVGNRFDHGRLRALARRLRSHRTDRCHIAPRAAAEGGSTAAGTCHTCGRCSIGGRYL